MHLKGHWKGKQVFSYNTPWRWFSHSYIPRSYNTNYFFSLSLPASRNSKSILLQTMLAAFSCCKNVHFYNWSWFISSIYFALGLHNAFTLANSIVVLYCSILLNAIFNGNALLCHGNCSLKATFTSQVCALPSLYALVERPATDPWNHSYDILHNQHFSRRVSLSDTTGTFQCHCKWGHKML